MYLRCICEMIANCMASYCILFTQFAHFIFRHIFRIQSVHFMIFTFIYSVSLKKGNTLMAKYIFIIKLGNMFVLWCVFNEKKGSLSGKGSSHEVFRTFTSAPCSFLFFLHCTPTEDADGKPHKRNSVRLAIRKLTYGPSPEEKKGEQPSAEVQHEFTFSPAPLTLEVTLDKEVGKISEEDK